MGVASQEMPLRAIIEVGDEDEGGNIAGGAMEGRKADIMEILGGSSTL